MQYEVTVQYSPPYPLEWGVKDDAQKMDYLVEKGSTSRGAVSHYVTTAVSGVQERPSRVVLLVGCLNGVGRASNSCPIPFKVLEFFRVEEEEG